MTVSSEILGVKRRRVPKTTKGVHWAQKLFSYPKILKNQSGHDGKFENKLELCEFKQKQNNFVKLSMGGSLRSIF